MGVVSALLLAMVPAPVATAQTPPLAAGPVQRCTASGAGPVCRPTSLSQFDLAEPVVTTRQIVSVSRAGAASRLPIAITLIGTMSSEVRWNGTLIGRNGRVGGDAASETPGRFRATIAIPREIVRVGRNVLDIRMSAHHRWLPVHRPVQRIAVEFYKGSSSAELGAYWPALLTAGALVVAALYFGAAALVGRSRREALLLTGVAVCATLQLAIETSRSFIDYAYPWHIARVTGIVLLVAITSALMVSYAARRYAPQLTRRTATASVVTSIGAVTVLPLFDTKAWACLLATAILCLLCATTARERRDGRVGMGVALLFALLLLWRGGDVLDRGYYLFVAVLLAGLVAEQVFGLRQLYSSLAVERDRGAALAARLEEAKDVGPSTISFRDGTAIHRVAEDEIVRITAADDFCELTLTDRRPLLVGGTLRAFEASLPDQFVRVHKSCIINLAHVQSMNPKPGGGHQLLLRDGTSTPVGRTYRDLVLARLQ